MCRTFTFTFTFVNLKPRKLLMYLARFRTSSHNLEIEIGRHRDKLLSERLCKFCEKMGDIVIEDEFHFLLSCEMYSELRKNIAAMYCSTLSEF